MMYSLEYEEASALAETITPQPIPELLAHVNPPETCDCLWLPPCPACSQVAIWQRPALDRWECPGFYTARHCTERWGKPYFMLRGCDHATALGMKFGPVVNRLKVAVAWRQRAAELAATRYQQGYTEAQRAAYLLRLGHPSLLHGLAQ